MGRNKKLRIRLDGLRRQITDHRIKIALEQQRATPDRSLIRHWEVEISRLRKSHFGIAELRWLTRWDKKRIHTGCSKRPSSKAAASEEARRTLRYVEPLSEARTPLVDFFSILLKLGNRP